MQTLAPGVTQVGTGRGNNAFLIDGDDGLTLVDVGWGGAHKALFRALAELGRRPADITRIVLTHAHPDHVKGAPELRRRTGAAILVHRADAGWLANGRVPREGRSGRFGHVLDGLPLMHWKPFEPDGVLVGDEIVAGSGGLRVIHTPGHTPGHIVLVHEPTGTALVGDALFHVGSLAMGPDGMACEPAARGASAARIPDTVTAVGFAHGTPLSGAGIETFHAFLSQYR